VENQTDELLMETVKQGYYENLSPLYERHSRLILNYFNRLTGDRESSRDLTQMVFERLLRYRRSYKSGARFRPWMFQIARNVLADHWKRSARMPADSFDENESGDLEQASQAATGSEPSWRQERAGRELREAMAQLRPADREVLVLSRFHGMRYDEIALVMKKSVTAVKTQSHRALMALREIYFSEETAHGR
jgi:RNA polymerase sigma-70 factor (ECF subfamily)